jgi:hypothetical protein
MSGSGLHADLLLFMTRSRVWWLHCLMEIRSRIMVCPSNDEHFVRRLGKAVVVQWDALPSPTQDLILKQAVLMHDQHRVLQLRHKLKAFIQNSKIVE